MTKSKNSAPRAAKYERLSKEVGGGVGNIRSSTRTCPTTLLAPFWMTTSPALRSTKFSSIASADGGLQAEQEPGSLWGAASRAAGKGVGPSGCGRGKEGSKRGKEGLKRGKEGSKRGKEGSKRGKEGSKRGKEGSKRGKEGLPRGARRDRRGARGAENAQALAPWAQNSDSVLQNEGGRAACNEVGPCTVHHQARSYERL